MRPQKMVMPHIVVNRCASGLAPHDAFGQSAKKGFHHPMCLFQRERSAVQPTHKAVQQVILTLKLHPIVAQLPPKLRGSIQSDGSRPLDGVQHRLQNPLCLSMHQVRLYLQNLFLWVLVICRRMHRYNRD